MKPTKMIYGITLAVTCSSAVTAKAQNLYVGSQDYGTIGAVIGEYTTSGTTVNASLITPPGGIVGIGISGNNLFVESGPTIGEYTTSGATVNASLISGLDNPQGIAVSGSELFVPIAGSGTIGEYTTSGTTVNASLISGLNGPSGIAISGNELFVANYFSGTVGEYTTSGATVNASLITGLYNPDGIAISPVPEPSPGPLAGLGAAVLWLCRRRACARRTQTHMSQRNAV